MRDYGYEVGHSSVIHGYRQAKKLIDSDPDYKQLVKDIKAND